MGECLVIEDLAKRVGLSPYHFHRLFTAEMGEPPATFLRRIRMDAAALRLRWADEPTDAIAHALGFHSRPAFIRAFERQFGVPPARFRKAYREGARQDFGIGGSRRVTLREIESFHLLVKRYTGNIFRLGEYWQDFAASLPEDITLPGKALFIGRLHDDFRITDPDKVRYDCGITVSAIHEDSDGSLARRHLYLERTHEGRYAAIQHRGHFETVPGTYDLLCHNWLIPNGKIPSPEPALEVHMLPRHLQDKENLEFMVLFPIE